MSEKNIAILSAFFLIIALIILLIPRQVVAGFWSAGLEVSDSSSRKTITLGTWDVGGNDDPFYGIPTYEFIVATFGASGIVPPGQIFIYNGQIFQTTQAIAASQIIGHWANVALSLEHNPSARYRAYSVVRRADGRWFWTPTFVWVGHDHLWREIYPPNMNLFDFFPGTNARDYRLPATHVDFVRAP